jgi:hypothetical protein
MGIDQGERRRQHAADRPKSKRHPFVALEHRIIDSPAYADLGFAARELLVLLARQLTRDSNGHLQATYAWCKRYGFGSEHTVRAAIAECIAHGFVYRTRSHGANKAWARYCLTWLPVSKRDGLYLDGFVPNAWHHWEPEKKSSRQKVQEHSSRKCSFTPELPAESAGKRTAETADYESCCHVIDVSTAIRERTEPIAAWVPGYLAHLSSLPPAERGFFIDDMRGAVVARAALH